MKKIKFLNGIGSMCAFAVIALVGSLSFTSCEKEDLNGTFTVEPAKATINVTVMEFESGTEMSGVTISASAGTVNGSVITIAAGADGNIAAQDVTVSATAPAGYEAIKPVSVHVNALKAGGEATYKATLVAVKTAENPDEQIVITSETKQGETITSSLVNPTHSHAGTDWWENANEYILFTKVSYKLYDEQEASGEVKNADVSAFIKGLNYNRTEDAVLEMKVSAWSLYRAWFEVYPTTTTYTFAYKNSGEVLGTVVANAKTGTAAQYEEMAHPSHAHQYQHGHGHGHGTDNAGGGIITID